MKKTDQELDIMLAEMAEEVPPMPADFHERWTAVIRSEAKNKPVTEEKGHKTPERLVLWTRILSAAAAFAFLIGGTILYRNSKRSLSLSAVPVQEETAATMDDGAHDDGIALFAVNAANSAVFSSEYEAASEETEESAAENAYMTAGASEMKASGMAPLMTAMPTQPAPVPAEVFAKEPAETLEEESDEDFAAESVEEETEEAGETGKASGFLQDAGAFFTDMGDFLLAALPYLAVLAVPAAAALVFRRRKK